ncbi:hypothetical protein SLS64_002100 [Diaporthe eres]
MAQVVDRLECSDKCAHFDTIEIQLSTYCQSCRQQVDNTAILNSVLRWKLGPCPARRRKIRPAKTNVLDGSPAPAPAPGTAKSSPRPPRKLSGAKSLSALREAASAPPTRELPPTPKRLLHGSASVENLRVSLDNLRLASPADDKTPVPRYSLDVKPAPLTFPLRRRASEAFEYAAGGNGQPVLARAHTVPKSKARPAVPQRPAPRTPTYSLSPRAEEPRSPRPHLKQVSEEPRPREYVHAKLCGSSGLPSPSAPGKNLFPAPQQQQKKPIDIHDPEWLARHGLKWDARGLGLVSAAV